MKSYLATVAFLAILAGPLTAQAIEVAVKPTSGVTLDNLSLKGKTAKTVDSARLVGTAAQKVTLSFPGKSLPIKFSLVGKRTEFVCKGLTASGSANVTLNVKVVDNTLSCEISDF